MEEDIKVLEKFIEKNIESGLRTELNANELQAIENLININRALEHDYYIVEKENKRLTSKNKSLEKEVKLMKSVNIDDNYISKAKLIEIADKYKKILNKLNKSEDIDRIKAINERLILIQELLLQEGDK